MKVIDVLKQTEFWSEDKFVDNGFQPGVSYEAEFPEGYEIIGWGPVLGEALVLYFVGTPHPEVVSKMGNWWIHLRQGDGDLGIES